jgi:hypothetical protein
MVTGSNVRWVETMGKVAVLDHTRNGILGALAFAIAVVWPVVTRFGPECLKAFVYERLSSTLNPIFVDYGPSVAMAALGSYLFWLSNGKSWRVRGEPPAQAGRRRGAPMYEVVAHVARWIDDTDEAKFWPEARRVIRQAALDGKIKICGHKSEETGNATETSWSLVRTAVPQAYWELAEITVLATAISWADQFVVHTGPHRLSDGRFTQEKIPYFAKLTANWSEVKKIWP